MAHESEPKPVYVRLDDTLLAKIDRYAEHLATEQPGFKPTRSDVIRILLHKALDAEESQEKQGRKSRGSVASRMEKTSARPKGPIELSRGPS